MEGLAALVAVQGVSSPSPKSPKMLLSAIQAKTPSVAGVRAAGNHPNLGGLGS